MGMMAGRDGALCNPDTWEWPRSERHGHAKPVELVLLELGRLEVRAQEQARTCQQLATAARGFEEVFDVDDARAGGEDERRLCRAGKPTPARKSFMRDTM
jgi:hypothetical protein